MTELVYLNFENIQTMNDFHDMVYDAFSFPTYYGRNADAFWDCITDICDDTIVYILNYSNLSIELEIKIHIYIDLLVDLQDDEGLIKLEYQSK